MQPIFDNVDIKNQLIKGLQCAQYTIEVAVAWFTDSSLFYLILEAVRRGVKVCIILHRDDVNQRVRFYWDDFTNSGGVLYWHAPLTGTMHHKFCVVDGETCFFGTYNWTIAAASLNRESLLVIRDEQIALSFRKEFGKLLVDPFTVIHSGVDYLMNIKYFDNQKETTKSASEIFRHHIIEMAFIEGGLFEMGHVFTEKDDPNQIVQQCTIDSFYLAHKQVTFEEYDLFCEAVNKPLVKDEGWGRHQRPIINVDWYTSIEYCNWKSESENLYPVYQIKKDVTDLNNKTSYDSKKWAVTFNRNANGYRLPSEAEWRYAARERGQNVKFGNGKDIANTGEINFDGSGSLISLPGENRGKTVPVGSLNCPNLLGLHDMSGNVWEWCWDWLGDYSTFSQTNPVGANSGFARVICGGSWNLYALAAHVA